MYEQNVIRKDPNPFPKVLLYCLARWAVKSGKKQGYELCMQGIRMKQSRKSCNLSLKKIFKNALNWKNFSYTKISKILSLDLFSTCIIDESLDIIVYIKKLWKKIVTKIYQKFMLKIFLSYIFYIFHKSFKKRLKTTKRPFSFNSFLTIINMEQLRRQNTQNLSRILKAENTLLKPERKKDIKKWWML